MIRLDYFMPVDQIFLTSVNCVMSWGKRVLVVELSCALWGVSQDLGLYPLDASNNHPPLLHDNQNCMTSKIANWPPGAKLFLVENHCCRPSEIFRFCQKGSDFVFRNLKTD